MNAWFIITAATTAPRQPVHEQQEDIDHRGKEDEYQRRLTPVYVTPHYVDDPVDDVGGDVEEVEDDSHDAGEYHPTRTLAHRGNSSNLEGNERTQRYPLLWDTPH